MLVIFPPPEKRTELPQPGFCIDGFNQVSSSIWAGLLGIVNRTQLLPVSEIIIWFCREDLIKIVFLITDFVGMLPKTCTSMSIISPFYFFLFETIRRKKNRKIRHPVRL